MGGVYRIQTCFGFLYFFYIYKAPYLLVTFDCDALRSYKGRSMCVTIKRASAE